MGILVSKENLIFFQAIASETRMSIINLLEDKQLNIYELATLLGLSSTIIGKHILILEKARIVKSILLSGKRGQQKLCSLYSNKEEIFFRKNFENSSTRTEKISIFLGNYFNYFVNPTCGLASTESMIGAFDDSRYFSHPKRHETSLIWFTKGWLEYHIPAYLIKENLFSIEISLEICAEYQILEDEYKSDIFFFLNNKQIGMWTAPNKPHDRKGRHTPEWWTLGAKYGYLKNIKVTEFGSFIDGELISNINLSDILQNSKFAKDMIFKISVPGTTKNSKGINIFGKGFGDHDQNIEIKMNYK